MRARAPSSGSCHPGRPSRCSRAKAASRTADGCRSRSSWARSRCAGSSSTSATRKASSSGIASVQGPFGRLGARPSGRGRRPGGGLAGGPDLLRAARRARWASCFGPALVRDRLASTFAYRHRQIARDLVRQQRIGAGHRLSVAISGASGLIGRALGAFLGTAGHRVIRLVRGAGRTPARRRDPLGSRGRSARSGPPRRGGRRGAPRGRKRGRWPLDLRAQAAHPGEPGAGNVAAGRRRSPPCSDRPRVLISASGVNVYGAHGEEPVDESAPPGTDFLAEVATAWERAAAPAAAARHPGRTSPFRRRARSQGGGAGPVPHAGPGRRRRPAGQRTTADELGGARRRGGGSPPRAPRRRACRDRST